MTKENFIEWIITNNNPECKTFKINEIHRFDENRICVIYEFDKEQRAINYTDDIAKIYYKGYLEMCETN